MGRHSKRNINGFNRRRKSEKLEKLDINRIKTGTLDSITEEVLREFREPGTPALL